MRIAASFLVIAALLLGIRLFVTNGREEHHDVREVEAFGKRRLEASWTDSEDRWPSRAPRRSVHPKVDKSIEFRVDEDATTTPELMSKFVSSGPITVRRMFELMGPPRGAADAGFGDMSFIYWSSDETGLFVSVSSNGQDPFEYPEGGFFAYEVVSIQSLSDDSIETIWRRYPQEETVFNEESPGALGSEDWSEDPFADEDPFALKEDAEQGD